MELKGFESQKPNSILDGSTRICNNVFLASKAWRMNGTPSPIYREGDGIFLGGECEDLL